MPSMSSLNFVSTAANGTVLDDCFKRETQVPGNCSFYLSLYFYFIRVHITFLIL